MTIRSVSLCEHTSQVAAQMPNFSAFVRDAILDYASSAGQGIHTQARENRIHGKCNPMAKSYCRICWSDGRPDRDDWISFRMNPDFPIQASQAGRYEHLVKQTFAYNEPQEESSDTISDQGKPKTSWIRRFFRQFF